MACTLPAATTSSAQMLDLAEEWGRFNIPDQLPVIDGLLAASAKVRGWTLVTRNVTDFGRSGGAGGD